MWKFDSEHHTPYDIFHEVTAHNILYPEDGYRLVGVTFAGSRPRLVLQQDAVKSHTYSTQRQIRAYNLARGFSMGLYGEDAKGDGITIGDQRDDNVLLDEDMRMHVIDAVIRFEDEPEKVLDGLAKYAAPAERVDISARCESQPLLADLVNAYERHLAGRDPKDAKEADRRFYESLSDLSARMKEAQTDDIDEVVGDELAALLRRYPSAEEASKQYERFIDDVKDVANTASAFLDEPVRRQVYSREEIMRKAYRGGIAEVVDGKAFSDLRKLAMRAIPESVRREIVANPYQRLDVPFNKYIRDLAYAGRAEDETGLLSALLNRIYAEVGLPELSEAEARMILFCSFPDPVADDLYNTALKTRARHHLGLDGEGSGSSRGPSFSVKDIFSDTNNEARASYISQVEAAEEQKKRERKEVRDALKEAQKDGTSLREELKAITHAMSVQRTYDKKTVDGIVKFARSVLREAAIEQLSVREVNRLLTLVKGAQGRSPAYTVRYADQLMDTLLDNLVHGEQKRLKDLMKVTGVKVNKQGVEVKDGLDVQGQLTLRAMRDWMDRPLEQIQNQLVNLSYEKESGSDAVRTRAEAQYAGLALALEYQRDIADMERKEDDLREQLSFDKEAQKIGEISRKAYEEYLHEASQDIRYLQMERIDLYRQFASKVEDVIAGGKAGAALFIDRQQARQNMIHSLASADLAGVRIDTSSYPKGIGPSFVNSSLVSLLNSPLSTFFELLKVIGRRSPDGHGYTTDYFMSSWEKAASDKYKGIQEAVEILDRKTEELFGGEARHFADLYKVESKAEAKLATPLTITFETPQTAGKANKISLLSGVYVYMVNKMPDGRMKLRRMGIEEEDVQALTALIRKVEPRFLTMADWIQEEYLTERRNKYNAVHEDLFGAPMSAIEDYVPLVINQRERFEERNAMQGVETGEHLKNITGSIIKRTHNSLPVDIINTNMVGVVLNHINNMEEWAAYAYFREDLKTLLSYNPFMNKVMSMTTIYGSGRDLWKRFVACSAIAAEQYYNSRSKADRAAVYIAQGATSAAINLRLWTAAKQFASIVTFFADARPGEIAKAMAHWKGSWDWCMANIPLFEKRWKNGEAGFDILEAAKDETTNWSTVLRGLVGGVGMKANRFVDACTIAAGTKAVYETEKTRLLKAGFPEDVAERKAKTAASQSFNTTQQSSEKAYLSEVQAERTWLTSIATAFRNGPFGFTRRYFAAARMLRSMNEADAIAFEQQKAEREGMGEEDAKAYAKRKYDRRRTKAVIDMVVMGVLAPLFWNVMSEAPYLLFGKDPEEKRRRLRDSSLRALLLGPYEGLLFGPQITYSIWTVGVEKKKLDIYQAMLASPLESDLERLYHKVGSDNVAALSELIFLAGKVLGGVDLRTISDLVYAVVEGCEGDLGLAREVELMMLKIASVPRSQVEELWIDELRASQSEASRLTPEEVTRRYVDYKIRQGASLTHFLYGKDAREKLEKKYSQRLRNKAKERANKNNE